ncbi:hypothetical protein C3F00_038870, partial [Pseudomonas sp. MWU13-2860]
QYNAFGEVSSETDGRGNITTFEYSAFGQLLAKQDPHTVIVAAGDQAPPPVRTQYRYDALGNLVATADANGQLNRHSWLAGSERGRARAAARFTPTAASSNWAMTCSAICVSASTKSAAAATTATTPTTS